MLPEGKTARGRKLAWRNGSLTANDPAAAWDGLLDARGLSENGPFFAPQLADLPGLFGMVDMDKAAGRIFWNWAIISLSKEFSCSSSAIKSDWISTCFCNNANAFPMFKRKAKISWNFRGIRIMYIVLCITLSGYRNIDIRYL